MDAYDPPVDFSRHDLQLTFLAGMHRATVHAAVLGEIAGAGALNEITGTEDEDFAELLVTLAEDPQNKDVLGLMYDEDRNIVGIALHMTDLAGNSFVLTEDHAFYLVGVSIVAVAPGADLGAA